MLFISLYDDSIAVFVTPLISSYMPPKCTYSFVNDELLVYADIETEEQEVFFGVKHGELIARFTVVDENTLLFQSSTIPLYADRGARYVAGPPGNAYLFDYAGGVEKNMDLPAAPFAVLDVELAIIRACYPGAEATYIGIETINLPDQLSPYVITDIEFRVFKTERG